MVILKHAVLAFQRRKLQNWLLAKSGGPGLGMGWRGVVVDVGVTHLHVTGLFCSTCSACLLSRFSHVQLFVTLWTIACQAPVHGILRQEYWSGLPFPLPGDLPTLGTEPESPVSPALAGGFFIADSTWEAPIVVYVYLAIF